MRIEGDRISVGQIRQTASGSHYKKGAEESQFNYAEQSSHVTKTSQQYPFETLSPTLSTFLFTQRSTARLKIMAIDDAGILLGGMT